MRLLKYGVLVGGSALLVLGLYLSLRGLPEPWTRAIERQLQFSGLVVSVDRIRLGVCEGIIASRVRCHRRGDIGEPVFEAEKVVLQFNPRRWLQGDVGVSGGQVKNGLFRLLAADGAAGPRMLVFDQLEAAVAWDTSTRLRVESFSARLAGIRLTGRGDLRLPEPSPSGPAAAGEGLGEARLGSLIERLLQAGRDVRLNNELNAEIEFEADVSDLRQLALRVRLDSRDTRIGRSGAAAWRARVVSRGLAAKGLVEIKGGEVLGVPVEKAECRFACDPQSLVIERLEAVVGRGRGRGPVSLSLHYGWASTEFEGRASSEFDLRAALPALRRERPEHAWILEAFRFSGPPPLARAEFRGRLKPEYAFRLESSNAVRNLAYREVAVSAARVGVAVERIGTRGVVVTLAPLDAVRPEGAGRGWIRVDMEARTASFDASATLDPPALAQMIDPFVERLVRQFRFEGPFRAAGWGTAGLGQTRPNDLNLAISARRAGWNRFLADECTLDLRQAGDVTEITDMRGAIHGGRFEARASISIVPGGGPLHYDLEADVRDVDLGRLMAAVAAPPAGPLEGAVSAHLVLEGLSGEGQGASARGRGRVTIREGRVFQVPLFGGLSDFLAGIIPGLGALMRQTEVEAEFEIANGKIHSDEILIEGDVFSLVGRGAMTLDGALDFTVQVKLLRKHTLAADIFRFVTHPVSRLLEFHLGGTLAAPQWRPVNIPKEVFLIFD